METDQMIRNIIMKFKNIFYPKKNPQQYHTKIGKYDINRDFCLNNPTVLQYVTLHREYMRKYSTGSTKEYWEDYYKFIDD